MVEERLRMVIRSGERCPWGVRCKHGLAASCRGLHSHEEVEHFARKQEIQSEEARRVRVLYSGVLQVQGPLLAGSERR